MAGDRLPAGIDREMRRDQRGQFVLDIGFHAETGGPGGLGRIDVEARALPEIIRLVVGHVLAARARVGGDEDHAVCGRSEEHTSELQSLMRISYAVFCLKKKNK